MPTKPTLVYWDIRGLAQPIRTMLAYVGIDFHDKLIVHDTAGEKSWDEEKAGQLAGADFDFPNLPYYVDGDVKLTQSVAIMRHIGRSHGLLGSTAAEQAKVDVWVHQTMDFRSALSAAVYRGYPPFEKVREEFAPHWLSGFERALGAGDHFCAGPLSIADFMLVEALDHIRAFIAAKADGVDVLSSYPRLSALVARFHALPSVATHLSRPEIKNLPWNGPSAQFR